MKLTFIQIRSPFVLLFGLIMIVLIAGCDGDNSATGGGGGGCVFANCFPGGGRSGGPPQNPNLSVSAVPGDRQNTLTFSLTSGSAASFNIYWSTSPDTATLTWNKIEGAISPFIHDGLTNGIPRFYGVTAVSGSSEGDPSAVVGAMPGKWTELNPSLIPPQPRDSHTAVYNATTDRMIIFGGKTQSTIFQDLWILSDATGAIRNPAWTPLSPNVPPDRRASHTAVYNKQTNKMIVFAGSGSTDGSTLLKQDLRLLSDADNTGILPTWQEPFPAGTVPSPRWGHAAVYDEQEDIMIVFGGAQTGVAIFNDVWVLERATQQFTSTWRQIPMPATGGPSARCCMAVGYDSANRRMIVFGGSGFGQNGPIQLGDLWTLTFNQTFETATWQELTPSGGTAPSARCCAASVWDGSKFLLFGGGTFNDSSDDKIYALVLQSSTFATADGPSGGPSARTFPTAVPAGHFLLFGGTASFTPFNDLWRLD